MLPLLLIVNTDIAAAGTANIAVNKLAAGSAAQILLNSAAPTPTWTTVTGDIGITVAGATTVTALQHNPVGAQFLGANQDGYVLTWVNSSEQWQAEPRGGETGVTNISTGYNVVATDTFISVGTLSSIITITLLSSPLSDTTIVIKDANGSAAKYPITISGNGNLIDGLSFVTISSNYGFFRMTYNSVSWCLN